MCVCEWVIAVFKKLRTQCELYSVYENITKNTTLWGIHSEVYVCSKAWSVLADYSQHRQLPSKVASWLNWIIAAPDGICRLFLYFRCFLEIKCVKWSWRYCSLIDGWKHNLIIKLDKIFNKQICKWGRMWTNKAPYKAKLFYCSLFRTACKLGAQIWFLKLLLS